MIPESLNEAKQLVEDISSQIEIARGNRIWQDYTNSLKMISQVVFTRSSGFLLELIQNAEDAGLGLDKIGEFDIALDKEKVRVTHNGQPFSKNDVGAICGIRSSKKPEKGTLGYLGIGFKSVFKVSDCPEIHSGWLHFKFDRNCWDDPGNTPWHVLPIWLDETSEPEHNDKTTFLIPFRDEESYQMLLKEASMLKTELYLFIKWLKKIKVTDEVSGQTWTLENMGENKDGITTLKRDNIEQRFKFFRRHCKPFEDVRKDRLTQEYRANVKEREICVAFALDTYDNLAPMEAGAMYGGVYSFLPLGEERSGVKFPIQADFLVQPGRDAINYESKWNHWLVEEVCNLCKVEVLPLFKRHPRWKFQILPAFEFNKYKGQEQYDKLFGPKLVEPLSDFLRTDRCVPTWDDGWARPSQSLMLEEDEGTVKALESAGILEKTEMAFAFGGQLEMNIAHTFVKNSYGVEIRKVDRRDLLSNSDLLEKKAGSRDTVDWFRRLYLWLASHQKEERDPYDRRKKNWIGYWQYKIVLGADERLYEGRNVWLPDLPATDPLLKSFAAQIQTSKVILHPEILASATNDEERTKLRGFLIGYTGMQLLNPKTVCEEILLPKVLTKSPQPSTSELLEHTRICQKWLGAEGISGKGELWILAKDGEIRAAKEVLLSSEFKPQLNWEANQKYLQCPNFLSEDYLQGSTEAIELDGWRRFFEVGGVKRSPDNGVEVFAMRYAQEVLMAKYLKISPVDKENYGYDLEAETATGDIDRIEVKGLTEDNEVELSSNETAKADQYKEKYHLCIVSSIPENPALYMVPNPAAPGIGKKDKLRLPAEIWRTYKI